MIAGGTGFAPLKSMLRHVLESGVRTGRSTSTGVRARRRTFTRRSSVLEWARRYPRLALHRGAVAGRSAMTASHHRLGWVHEAVLADYPDLSAFEIYAAGPPALIEAIRAKFRATGRAARAAVLRLLRLCAGLADALAHRSESLAQLASHPPAHLQRRLAAAQPHVVLSIGVALDSSEVSHADERVAVDAHEVGTELLFERPQRILDEILALDVPHRRVLLLGEKILHVLDRNEPQPFAMARGDVGTALLAAGGRRDLLQLWPGEPSGVLERGGELFLADRLQQIADRLRLESVDRIFIERRREDDGRRLREQRSDAARPRCRPFPACAHRAVRHRVRARWPACSACSRDGLADDFASGDLDQQAPQPLARRRLVIDDEHLEPLMWPAADRGSRRTGIAA